MLSFFPLDVLDKIWDVIESVSEGCLTYSYFSSRTVASYRTVLVYKFRKIICKYDFLYHFKKIIVRYKKIGYNIEVLRQTACLVVNPNKVNNFAYLFDCTTVDWASD